MKIGTFHSPEMSFLTFDFRFEENVYCKYLPQKATATCCLIPTRALVPPFLQTNNTTGALSSERKKQQKHWAPGQEGVAVQQPIGTVVDLGALALHRAPLCVPLKFKPSPECIFMNLGNFA